MRGKSKFFSLVLVALILIAMVAVPVSAAAPTVIAGSPGESVVIQADPPAAGDAAENPLKDMAVDALALVVFTTGLTPLLKKLGVKDNWLTIGAWVLSVALGIGYKVALKPPVGFSDWFFYGLFGFLCGLVATGIYDAYGNKSNNATINNSAG